MEKEKKYTYVGATYVKLYDEAYVQARTVFDAYDMICYSLYLGKPDMLTCGALDIDIDLPDDKDKREACLQRLEN